MNTPATIGMIHTTTEMQQAAFISGNHIGYEMEPGCWQVMLHVVSADNARFRDDVLASDDSIMFENDTVWMKSPSTRIYTVEAETAADALKAALQQNQTFSSAGVITVTQAATLAACNVSYIRAEIAAGRLPAEKIGSQWVITREAFDEWMQNPKRGSRQSR